MGVWSIVCCVGGNLVEEVLTFSMSWGFPGVRSSHSGEIYVCICRACSGSSINQHVYSIGVGGGE